jgi:purine-binding chemotaxis protein CheW
MNAPVSPHPAPAAFAGSAVQIAGNTSQFITCTLSAAEYGIDIMAVREIKGWATTTALPHAPAWIRGVINLRGVIVPILDLRARFGMPPTEPTPMHVVVIIETEKRTIGVLVDAVSDIIAVAPDAIRPVPDVGLGAPERLLSGLVPLERGMVALVALDCLLELPDETVALLPTAPLHS